MSRNTDTISNAIKRKIGGAGTSQGIALEIFSEVAKEVFAWLKNQTYYQNRTFNLSDSIGFGIYDNGTLAQWIANPDSNAAEDKTYTYHGVRHTINGRRMLEEAISGSTARIGMYTMKVFCAVPYGAWVELGLGNGGPDKAGVGWWSDGLMPEVRDRFVAECKKRKISVKQFSYGES